MSASKQGTTIGLERPVPPAAQAVSSCARCSGLRTPSFTMAVYARRSSLRNPKRLYIPRPKSNPCAKSIRIARQDGYVQQLVAADRYTQGGPSFEGALSFGSPSQKEVRPLNGSVSPLKTLTRSSVQFIFGLRGGSEDSRCSGDY